VKNKKILLMLAGLAIVSATGLSLASCGGDNPTPSSSVNETTHSLTWTVDEHVKVSISGYEERPTSVSDGTTLTMTLTPDEGYELSQVLVNNKKLTASRNGQYIVRVSADTTIVISAYEAVESLTITTKPTKLSGYFDGDTVDTTGMVVTAHYKTNRDEVIAYSDEGYSLSPSVLSAGDTSFKVVYRGKEATVNLDATVEYLVKVDLAGGTLSQEYVSQMQALNLNNFDFDSTTSKITFSYYQNLPSNLPLPTSDQITKEDNTFEGFYDGEEEITEIAKNSARNFNLVAKWQVTLVNISKAELLIEEGKPYLQLTGTFVAATEVSLYFYEGNDKIDLTTDEKVTGTRDETFKIKFDLTILSDYRTSDGENYETKWMDVLLTAKMGDKTEAMPIKVEDIEVDMESKIELNNVTYLFASYEGYLKVYYNLPVYHFSYEMKEVEDKDTLVVSIVDLNSKYIGKYAEISWYMNAEGHNAGGTISSEGSVTINVDISQMPTATPGYAHFGIYESADDKTTPLYGGTGQNLLVANSTTSIPAITKGTAGSGMTYAVSYSSSDGSKIYYVGYAWDGLMIYIVPSTNFTATNVSLKQENNVVYYVVTGTTNAADGEADLEFDFQHNSNIDGAGWDYPYNSKTDSSLYDPKATVSNGTFELSVPVSTLLASSFTSSSATKWVFSAHMNEGNVEAEITEVSFTQDSITYSLLRSEDTWQIASLVMEKTAP